MTKWDLKHLVRTINSQRRSHSILLQIPYWQKKQSPQNHQAICFQCNTYTNRLLTTRLLTAR